MTCRSLRPLDCTTRMMFWALLMSPALSRTTSPARSPQPYPSASISCHSRRSKLPTQTGLKENSQTQPIRARGRASLNSYWRCPDFRAAGCVPADLIAEASARKARGMPQPGHAGPCSQHERGRATLASMSRGRQCALCSHCRRHCACRSHGHRPCQSPPTFVG
jgi:hypothetical protein